MIIFFNYDLFIIVNNLTNKFFYYLIVFDNLLLLLFLNLSNRIIMLAQSKDRRTQYV